MMEELALGICLAVRQGQEEQAKEYFEKILQLTDGSQLLRCLGDGLLTAARAQQQELFTGWLEQAGPRLRELLGAQETTAAACSFLQALLFTVCDKRLSAAFAPVGMLTKHFWRSHSLSTEAEALWTELLNLAARMMRRGWQAETDFLLRLLGRELLRQQDLTVWSRRLLQLQLHFVVYTRWDGFAKACLVYREFVYVQLLLLKRAGRAALGTEQQAAWLLLLLRNMRDLIAHVSRTLMQEDMDIFRQWYQFLWQLIQEKPAYNEQLRRLLQLTIWYWQSSRPRTSRRQAQFLQDLLQPSMISDAYRELFRKIS